METKPVVDYMVIGQFRCLDDTKRAISALREQSIESFEVFSPFPNHELEDHLYEGKPKSPVRLFTLFGGIAGCLGAFLMTSWMSLDYPLRTSAKPIVSFPAFAVIGFECTILIGGLATLAAMFHFCRLPNIFRNPGYRGSFSSDRFGVSVRVGRERAGDIEELFRSVGAEKIESEYVR